MYISLGKPGISMVDYPFQGEFTRVQQSQGVPGPLVWHPPPHRKPGRVVRRQRRQRRTSLQHPGAWFWAVWSAPSTKQWTLGWRGWAMILLGLGLTQQSYDVLWTVFLLVDSNKLNSPAELTPNEQTFGHSGLPPVTPWIPWPALEPLLAARPGTPTTCGAPNGMAIISVAGRMPLLAGRKSSQAAIVGTYGWWHLVVIGGCHRRSNLNSHNTSDNFQYSKWWIFSPLYAHN